MSPWMLHARCIFRGGRHGRMQRHFWYADLFLYVGYSSIYVRDEVAKQCNRIIVTNMLVFTCHKTVVTVMTFCYIYDKYHCFISHPPFAFIFIGIKHPFHFSTQPWRYWVPFRDHILKGNDQG